MIVGLVIAVVLAVPLLAFALIFAVGAACGLAAYHFSRQVVVQYQPMRKAFDPSKERTRVAAIAAKAAQEAADLEKSYLGGLQLTREQFVAGER